MFGIRHRNNNTSSTERASANVKIKTQNTNIFPKFNVQHRNDTNNTAKHHSNLAEIVIVVGGDGFCGWPTCLRLSKLGYEIHIVDSLWRREIDQELKTISVIPIDGGAPSKFSGREGLFERQQLALAGGIAAKYETLALAAPAALKAQVTPAVA